MDYMSLSTTTAIKGIFALIIFFSHTMQCIELSPGFGDRAFGYPMKYLEQLMVTIFFFYAGYGIAISDKNKEGYTKGFFKKRILKTLLHFDMVVLLFLVLQFILGNRFNPENYLYCWIGWLDIGNSSWFICVILALYVIAYVSLRLKERCSESTVVLTFSVSLLTIGLWIFLYRQKAPEHWWYDTVAVFPVGFLFYMVKRYVDTSSERIRILLTLLLVGGFVLWRHFIGIDDYGICATLFVLALTGITFFIKINNTVLQWLGKHCFSIYMLQRIPMLLFQNTCLREMPVLFTATTLFTTLFLAWSFTKVSDRIDYTFF